MDPKKQLQKLIDDIKTKQFRDGEAKGLVQTIGEEIKTQLSPAFKALSEDLKGEMSGAFKDAVNSIKIDMPEAKQPNISVNVPDVIVPEFNIPTPQVTVNVPKAEKPNVTVNPTPVTFPSEMALKGVTPKTPLHVQMVDQAGKPMMFPQSTVGGGRGDFFTIKGIQETIGVVTINPDGQPTYTVSGSGAGSSFVSLVNADGTYYNSAMGLPVKLQDVNATFFSAFNSGDYKAFPTVILDGSGAQITSFGGGTQYAEGATASTYTGTAVIFAEASSDAAKVVSSVDPLPTTLSTALDATIDSISTYQASGANFSVSITGANGTLAANIVDSSGVAYSGSNPLPITGTLTASAVQVQDSQSSTITSHQFLTDFRGLDTYIGGAAASTFSELLNADGRVKSEISTITGLNETNSGVLRTVIMTDSVVSVNAVTFNGNAPAVGLNETTTGVLRVVQMTDATNSINNIQWGGVAMPTGLNETGAGVVRVVQMSDTALSSNVVTFNGNAPATGLNETTSGVLRVVMMSDTAVSTTSQAQGLNETTAGVLRTVLMTDVTASTQNKLIARQTNPTAASDAATNFASSDDLGRTLTRPIQVRDLTKTAYVSIANGTETTLLAGVAGAFLDLIMITATNNSSAATQLDVRAVTAGNIIHTMYLPAQSGPIGFAPAVPWPQDATGNNWTIDMPDQTGTTVYVSALFSQEI